MHMHIRSKQEKKITVVWTMKLLALYSTSFPLSAWGKEPGFNAMCGPRSEATPSTVNTVQSMVVNLTLLRTVLFTVINVNVRD